MVVNRAWVECEIRSLFAGHIGQELAEGKGIWMHQGVYETLKQVARSGGLICYGEVAPLAGVDLNSGRGRREVGCLLAEVCQNEVQQGRPMLGSVVVRKDTRVPGEGYFRGAQRLGKFQGQSYEDKRAFWLQELERVHAYWSSH